MRISFATIACAGLVLCAMTSFGSRAAAQPSDTPSRIAMMHSIPADDDGVDSAGHEDGQCLKILGIQQCAQEESEIAQNLVLHGPAGIEGHQADKPSVVGFVRDGWPLVVGFEPQPGTVTILRVKLYHRRLFFPYYEVAYQQVLDPDGMRGPQTVVVDRVRLEGEPGVSDGVHVARYDVRSYRLVNNELVRDHGRPVRAPVTVFGFGAGPHSVGSLILRDVRFLAPSPLTMLHGTTMSTPFTYTLDRDYDAVSAEIMRCQGLCRSAAQIRGNLPRSTGRQAQGVWVINSRNTAGAYELVVRAWLQCGGASGLAALGHCLDDSSWAIGNSPRLQLVQ